MDASAQFHQRVRELFDKALERPPQERPLFLEVACAQDPQLLDAVAQLLRARDSQDSFLESGARAVQRIGRYVIRGELGRGAMGIVYDAVDPLIGRSVALKVILLERLTDPREAEFLRDRLFREARSAGKLFHPCIVVVLDVGQEGDTAFIAMEKVEGQTLQHMLAAGYRPSTDQTLGILHQTAAALDYAHLNGVVHRDIKPANIMVQAGMLVKVADFGIAKIMSAQNATQSGIVMGTPTYMSPEQIEGLPVDGRSDQFALSVLAYELLTGERPFQGDSLAALAHRIVYAERPLATDANPALPPSINAVLGRGFARSAADRYGSCGELVRAIETALDNPPPAAPIHEPVAVAAPVTPAPAPSPPTEATPAKKTGAGIWIFAIAMIALIAIAVAYVIYRPQVEAPSPKPAAASIVVQRFVAEPSSIQSGSASRLSWAVAGAEQITIDHGIGNVAATGSMAVTPSESTTYILTASGKGPEVRAPATIAVTAAETKAAETKAAPETVPPAARARQLYDAAHEKRRAGQVPEAVALLRQAAELGESQAMVELAESYRDGEGTAKNSAEAVRWFQKAAQAGNTSAMVELGGMYILGDGIPVSNELAFQWFQKAADRGNAAGMNDLASMYEQGLGVRPDLEKARALYRKSANLGNAEALRALERMGRGK